MLVVSVLLHRLRELLFTVRVVAVVEQTATTVKQTLVVTVVVELVATGQATLAQRIQVVVVQVRVRLVRVMRVVAVLLSCVTQIRLLSRLVLV